MVNDYKSKDDALTCGLYRDIMLLEYAKKKNLLMALVELERAIDRVFPELVWWALRYLNVMYVM
jgi:hypothetical protein